MFHYTAAELNNCLYISFLILARQLSNSRRKQTLVLTGLFWITFQKETCHYYSRVSFQNPGGLFCGNIRRIHFSFLWIQVSFESHFKKRPVSITLVSHSKILEVSFVGIYVEYMSLLCQFCIVFNISNHYRALAVWM